MKVLLLQPGGFKAGPITNLNFDVHSQRSQSTNQNTFKIERMRDPQRVILLKNPHTLVIYSMEQYSIDDELDLGRKHISILDFIYHKKTRYLYILTNQGEIIFVRVFKSESKFKHSENSWWKMNLSEENQIKNDLEIRDSTSVSIKLCTLAVNISGKHIAISGFCNEIIE